MGDVVIDVPAESQVHTKVRPQTGRKHAISILKPVDQALLRRGS